MSTVINNFCIYNGITGIGLDGFEPIKLKGLGKFIGQYEDDIFKIDDNPKIDKYESLSLGEVKSKAKKFCEDYLSLSDIYYLRDLTEKEEQRLNKVQPYDVYYSYLDSLLKKISIFELPIKLVREPIFYGLLEQCIFNLNDLYENNNQKPIFSNIELSNNLSLLSVPMLTHEYVHALEQSHKGFTDDYNNIDFLPIFIEKVVALGISKETLEIIERTRFLYMLDDLISSFDTTNEEQRKENISYLKSSLYALKYFDMFMNERKQKDKDKYFDEINKVLEGKIKVEEIIAKRGLTLTNCQDINTLLRRSHVR